MKAGGILLAAFVAALTAYATARLTNPEGTASASASPVYDRVMKSGIIRCGYAVWPPSNLLDADGKTHTGIGHDLMEEIGRRLLLRIEWMEEVGWGTAVQDVANGKYDAICTLMWPNSARARYADFSIPLYYAHAVAFVRENDTRFDADNRKINDPAVTLAYVDGTTPQKIAAAHFPLTKVLSFPEMSSTTETALAVTAGKADVMIWDTYNGAMFMQKNPGSIRPVPGKLASYGSSFLLPGNDPRFKTMIDHTIREIVEDGTFSRIFDAYGVRQYFSQPTRPYTE